MASLGQMESMLLLIWSVLAVRTVAFMPTIGQGDDPSMYTHESITLGGVDRAAAKFLTSTGQVNTTKTDPHDVIKEYFRSDTKGFQDYQQRKREFAAAVMNVYKSYRLIPDYTVNSERIRQAATLIQTTRLEIAAVMNSGSLNNASVQLLVDKVGKCLLILQSFYSNTNWIEMNGAVVAKDFGTLRPFEVEIASPETVTCSSCDDKIEKACVDNLLVRNQLTSGYMYGQLSFSKPPGEAGATEGKCSHGGLSDVGRDTPASGGINKETPYWTRSPHAHLHNISGLTAVKATEAFFVDTRTGLFRGLDEETIKTILQLRTVQQAMSLAMVVDVTGSMGDDIRSVKETLIGQLSAKIGTANEPKNYVLSTFSDPESLTTIASTTDGNEMIGWIDALYVSGGDDCPEYALSGLLAAINESEPYSPIYLATDADAKDEDMTDLVLQEAKAKHVKLQFILTGNCGYRSDADTRRKRSAASFDILADSTGGSVFRVGHDEVTEVLDRILEEEFPSSEAIIDYFVWSVSDTNTANITVDSETAVLVITITGPRRLEHASLALPNGTEQVFPNKYSKQYISGSKLTMSIQQPSPGIWKLTRHDSSLWTVNVTSSTYMNIDTLLKETDGSGLSYIVDRNAIVGKTYTLQVHIYNLNSSSSSFRLHLLDSQGADLYSHPVDLVFSPSVITGYMPIVTPNKDFYVQLSGVDQNGFEFQRMSKKRTKPVGVDLSVRPFVGNLDIGVTHNITYTLSNLGSTTQTYIVSITDDKGRIQSPTSYPQTLPAGNSTIGYFQIASQTELETVTYTVTANLNGSLIALQSSTSTVMFVGPMCSSVVTRKCRQSYTGSNCTVFTWSATAVFSFDISTYANPATMSMNIDPTNPKHLLVSGNCCHGNFTADAKSSARSQCVTSDVVVASDEEVIAEEEEDDEDRNDGMSDVIGDKPHRNDSQPQQDPVVHSSTNIGLIVGAAVGSAGVVVVIAVVIIIYKACTGNNTKKSKENTFNDMDRSRRSMHTYNSNHVYQHYRY